MLQPQFLFSNFALHYRQTSPQLLKTSSFWISFRRCSFHDGQSVTTITFGW